MAVNIANNKVVDAWNVLIPNAAEKVFTIFDLVQEYLTNADLPSVTWKMDKSGGRDCLVIAHQYLRDYFMYVSAREYGTFLEVNWSLTIEPGFFNKTFAKMVPGVYGMMHSGLDFYAQQELSAYTTVVHQSVKDAVKSIMDELNQDFSKINTRSRGILEVW